MTKNKREPLIHITKRVNIPIWFPLVVHAAALLLALLACAVLTLVMTGENPLSLLNSIINGSFGSHPCVGTRIQVHQRCMVGSERTLSIGFTSKECQTDIVVHSLLDKVLGNLT